MVDCKIIFELFKNNSKLTENDLIDIYENCVKLSNKSKTYITNYPRKEMYKRLLNCSDEQAIWMLNNKHTELEKAELINDKNKLQELKQNYSHLCEFHISKYPYYKWNNYNNI
tara:strand:+ start:277 stop:615 length:339 start_codon:yes stop_codon:yes gene_type:complete